MIPYKKIYTNIIGRLKRDLPDYYTYHDYKHTLYVLSKAIFLAKKMNIGEHETLLLKIACLYHDTGFLISRDNHEQLSCETLIVDLEHELTKEEVTIIKGMIMATKIPSLPQNQLEMIIADADLEYLGTNLFEQIGAQLKKEIQHFQPSLTENAWNELQLKFLKNHKYFTPWCKKYREPLKQQHLARIEENLGVV
jgi:HD superfamily phosphodiesterase